MAMLTKAQVKQNLKAIEATLIERVPELVKANPCEGPAYAVLLCYRDLTVNEYTPLIVVAPQSLREQNEENIKDELGEPAWAPHQRLGDAGLPEIHFDDEAFSKLCNDVYETIGDDWGDKGEEAVILPFRKMMYKAAKALNKLDWSNVLQVTDDFVATAVDYSGHWVSEDVPASIPAKQKKKLEKAGYLDSLASYPPELQAKIREWRAIEALPPHQRVERLIGLLEQIHAGEDVDIMDEFSIVKTIEESGKPAVLPSLKFIEARAGEPAYVKKVDERDSPAQRIRMMLFGMRVYNNVCPEAEQLLLSIIRKSLQHAKAGLEVALLINTAAEELHNEFEGYPEPTFPEDDDGQPATNIKDFLR